MEGAVIMKFLKSLQINALIMAIIYVGLGLLFILMPETVTASIAIILGIVLLVAGVVYIINYFRRWDIEYRSNGLAIGILFIFGALFLFFQSNLIEMIIPLLLGLAVVVSGTIKLQNAIVLYKTRERMWIPVLVLAVICLVLGFVIMIDPFGTLSALVIVIGIGLMLSGLSDLVIIILMAHNTAKLERAEKAPRVAKHKRHAEPVVEDVPIAPVVETPAAPVAPEPVVEPPVASPVEPTQEGDTV